MILLMKNWIGNAIVIALLNGFLYCIHWSHICWHFFVYVFHFHAHFSFQQQIRNQNKFSLKYELFLWINISHFIDWLTVEMNEWVRRACIRMYMDVQLKDVKFVGNVRFRSICFNNSAHRPSFNFNKSARVNITGYRMLVCVVMCFSFGEIRNKTIENRKLSNI